MPEPHPGLIHDMNDPSLPLKVLRVYPTDAEDVARDQGSDYTVQLELSRRATRNES